MDQSAVWCMQMLLLGIWLYKNCKWQNYQEGSCKNIVPLDMKTLSLSGIWTVFEIEEILYHRINAKNEFPDE